MGIINIETDVDPDLEKLKQKMRSFAPLKRFSGLYSAPAHPIVVHDEEDRPQNALDTHNGMEVHVGRMSYSDGILRIVALGNNLVRGAAGITVLTMETMKQMNLI